MVHVADENDVPPRWGRGEWIVEVEEGKPVDEVLATLTVKDPDTHNNLAYRVNIRILRIILIDGLSRKECLC